ncbi:pollen-specific leucine-rich repeat extensin-like protein 3 [Phoenix dactylifera]|uniref:Pollen-specific leucine-rich repeat extensin-like protein 3 n=1 Tax=Phoenix dactylifera TaxID=42345 RepID=A0A8B7CLT4_PHODC|nr:pollen-specific leucine-rich repeat extensin-like protein 3 [Phoenix dactylifera]
MNSSHFMDKQVTGMSEKSQGGDLFDLMDPQEEPRNNGGVIKKEEILPSYEFQPIRTVGSWPPMNAGLDAADSKKIGSSSLRYSGIVEPHEIAKVSHDKERDAYDVAAVAEIDRTVKKYADNLLHALEGVSSRLSQLESRTRYLESSVDELKVSVGNNHGSTDGKLRQLENILREVQTGVQVLRDKQDIAEAQLQLAKLQASKSEQGPEKASTGQPDSWQQVASPPQPVQQPLQAPAAPPQPSPHPSSLVPHAPPPPQQQNPSPVVLYPSQLPQPQMPAIQSLAQEPCLPAPVQSTESTHQQYQMPVQQPQPPPPQQYQPAPQLQQPYLQPIQPPQAPNPPLLQPPLAHPPEESSPYMPQSQSYPHSIRQPAPLAQPPTRPPPTQQLYGPNTSMYEPPASRSSPMHIPYSAGYGAASGPGFSEPYSYSGSPSCYSSTTTKPSPFSSSAPSSDGSNYQRLPTAKVLPQALPAESSSGGTPGNRMPIDDVVDKVATMGFSRDQVRAAVRRLTENGQSVDLNVVLDKLMNDGEIQPQKGWFGR